MSFTGYTGGASPMDTDVTSMSSSDLNSALEASDTGRSNYDPASFYNSFTTTTTFATFTTTVAPQKEQCGADGAAHYPSDMLIVTAVCAFVLAVLGTFGNLLTIIALPMSKKLRTTATAFVVNLAVVELLFCALILPMSGAQYVYLQRNNGESLLNDRDCVFFVVTRYTLTQVELQTILAIALTRAMAVAMPRMYTFMNKPSVIASYITVIWVYAFFVHLPTALGKLGSYGFNKCTMECDMVTGAPKARFAMLIIDAIIPVLLIVFLYIFVFIMVIRRACLRSRKFSNTLQPQQQVKKSSNRVARASNRANNKVVPPTSSNASTSSGTTDQRKGSNSSFRSLKRMVSDSSLRARFRQVARVFNTTRTHQSSTVSQRLCTNRRDMRVARTIFIIFLIVLICSVPVALAHMFDRTVKYPVQFLVVHILYWTQYCLNLVVYVLMNRQYRDAYIDCLSRVFPQFKRHQGRKFFWEKASISSKPPPVNPTPSSRPRLDSADAMDSTASEPEVAVPTAHPPIGAQGRLSTIPEANSSSAANDSVFSDPAKKEREASDKKSLQNHADIDEQRGVDSEEDDSENEFPEEEKQFLMDKEHWVTQNGSTGGNLPSDESKV